MAELALVAAVAHNRVIGEKGRLPWQLKEDLRRFRQLTTGHAVIMGRKTYDSILESLGKPLPDRLNIVVTRSPGLETRGGRTVDSLDAAILEARARPGEAFVIGGAEIYRLALPRAVKMYLTELDADFEGDTYFPEFDRRQWREESRERRTEGGLGYSFVTYERV